MKRILIVDDEPLIRQVIEDVLTDAGYEVLLASSGRTMLQVLETQQPDLILLDVMMPDGDGRTALTAMQSQPHLRNIPVVIVSTGVAHHLLEGVTVPRLTKPFDLEHLLRLVGDTIGPAQEPDS
jgi:CheY-like chemotaxis protein